MPLNEVPRVRLDVTMPAERITSQLMANRPQIEEAMRDGIDSAVRSADWATLAREAARSAIETALREQIDRYFRYGIGQKEMEYALAIILKGMADDAARTVTKRTRSAKSE